MKTALFIFAFLIITSIIAFFVLGFISKTGQASGLVEGRLSKCPNKPNCVCSEYKEDNIHYIEPISIPQDMTLDTLSMLKNLIQDMGGNIETETHTYLATTFTSAIFGFVDDLEIRIDTTQKEIHIRSGSRVGYGDAGVNKKRTELLKKRFNNRVSRAVQTSKYQ